MRGEKKPRNIVKKMAVDLFFDRSRRVRIREFETRMRHMTARPIFMRRKEGKNVQFELEIRLTHTTASWEPFRHKLMKTYRRYLVTTFLLACQTEDLV